LRSDFQVLAKASLPCPETAQMTCLADAVQFFKDRETKPDGHPATKNTQQWFKSCLFSKPKKVLSS
jgi:hypothetical protein